MVSPLKILDLKKFRILPISQKRVRIPPSTIDFIDEDFGISCVLLNSGKLATRSITGIRSSNNEGGLYEKFNILKTDDDDKSFMITTKNTDETRLYRDLTVQSNDVTSIRKIIRSKLCLRSILMDKEDNNDNRQYLASIRNVKL